LASRSRLRFTISLILFGIGIAPELVALAEAPQSQPKAQSGAAEFRRLLPLTKFYSTPSPLPQGQPGELIRWEDFDAYQLPEGVSARRILYHSRSGRGEDVATSGVVLTPDQRAPTGGWPVIAWAHRFTGIARQCAPSLMRNLNEGPLLSMYVNLGYAVVATDYAGLGTAFRNASADILSNADDVIDSVAAARAAVPQLGRKWIAMGESAGGLAALAVAESESDIRDPDYLGSIAVSGIADAKDFYEQAASGGSSAQLAVLAYEVQTLYPAFRPEEMLTERALTIYHQLETACAVASGDSGTVATQMVKPGWQDNSFAQQFFARNTIGKKPAYRPLLIVSGDADPVARIGMTARTVGRLCKQGDKVQFQRYQSPEFADVLGGSVREQITWIQGRFTGRPAPSNCQ